MTKTMDDWTPSGRAQTLIGVLLDAFEAGDRWVRFASAHTARFTGDSLVRNGIAEQDEASLTASGYAMRIRISDEWAAANGWPNRNWPQYRIEMAADRRDDPDYPSNPYLADTVEDVVFDAASWVVAGERTGRTGATR